MTTNAHNYPWRDATPPDIAAGRKTGSLRGCGYCGSMHPADLAAALLAGARLDPADRKYGWPHKFYVEGVPNPHAGMLESRYSTSHPKQEDIDAGKMIRVPTGRFSESTGEPKFDWCEAGKPAPETTYGKFYTEHLQDASAEDRDVIERHMGMHFDFAGEGISWWPYGTPKPVRAE